MKRSLSIVFLSVVLMLLGVWGAAAAGHDRPFSARWMTTFGPPVPNTTLGCLAGSTGIFEIQGGGVATHLGRNTFVAQSEVNQIGQQCGHTVITAANGDELEFDFAGGATPPDMGGNITFFGEWTVTGGTGRFSDAQGGGTYNGSASLFEGQGELLQEGTIDY